MHAVDDSAFVREGPDPEHVLVDHGDSLKNALVEFLLGPLAGPEDLQCKSCVNIRLVALFGIAPLKVAHHEADPCKLPLFLDRLLRDWRLRVSLMQGIERLFILVVRPHGSVVVGRASNGRVPAHHHPCVLGGGVLRVYRVQVEVLTVICE